MRLRIKALLVAASSMAMSAGCEGPQEIIPVAPPGFQMVREPTEPEVTAQALGEQSASLLAHANQKPQPSIVATALPTAIGKPEATPHGLIYETLVEGTGPAAKSGDTVDMLYKGTMTDGTVFDSSLDPKKPFTIAIGYRNVIQGWDEGIPGMKVGEKRKLTIPASLAYKEKGSGKIPPGAILIFEVELLKVTE